MSRFMRVVVLTGLFLGVAAAAVGLGGSLIAGTGTQEVLPPAPRIAESVAAKELVTHELIEGRVTLPNAIERFRAISTARPGFSWEVLRATYPGGSDDQCLGQQVIAYVATELRDEPDRAEALTARLKAELTSSAAPSGGPEKR
jgi:hypothetical protein